MNIKKYQVSLKQYRALYSVHVSPTYSACVFLLTWARMKDTVIVAIESNRRSKRLEGSTAKSKSIPCRPIQTPETCPAFSCPSFSCPSISCLDISVVRHFHVRHFQRPPENYHALWNIYTDFDYGFSTPFRLWEIWTDGRIDRRADNLRPWYGLIGWPHNNYIFLVSTQSENVQVSL